ncbi:MAG: hypothetical protein A2Z15_00260 [Chloroflexi bacterium RBG_16_50_11]|nr:MAG: hypothetical protein A2Z15_00260 [Chloroflexi bacterium RBG_16_50_11]
MKTLKLMGILMSLALLLSLAPAVWGAEDTVSGSFTPSNVTPTVTTLEIYSDPGLSSVANSLTPQVYYFVKVTAGDGNTIEDIDQIDVELFFDSGDADPLPPGVGDPQTCAILTWDKDGGGSEWTIDDGAGTTWSILSANCTKPAVMTGSSGDWVFVIMAGKVATESAGADNWDSFAEAIDGGGSGNTTTRDKEVLWYGEISTADTADFGAVLNGSGFADNTNEISDVSVTYISNGNYDQQIKTENWTGGSFTAIFDVTGTCNDAQEFSLLAYISDTFGSAVQVNTTGISIDNTGTITDETGDTVATNSLWLKIALTFSIDTYNGNITYIIADR